MLDGPQVLVVEELEAHCLGVLLRLQNGMDRENTAKSLPDGRHRACPDRQPVVLHLDREVRKRSKRYHWDQELEEKFHVFQRHSCFSGSTLNRLLKFLSNDRVHQAELHKIALDEFELGVLHDFVLGMVVVVEWGKERSEEVLGSPESLTSVLVRMKELKPQHGLRCH